jgi:hypothetical protein
MNKLFLHPRELGVTYLQGSGETGQAIERQSFGCDFVFGDPPATP